MQKTMAKKNDLKKKLLAAVAMLLVSCIMVVTSTYAWFTLSTAPEVTGIQTSVGANGNLEMMLLSDTSFGNPDAVKSAVGDSTKGIRDKNATWGNLVDLSDAAYGLGSITLLPSRLNLASINALKSAFLAAPSYGDDGRVNALDQYSVSGIYDTGAFKSSDSKYGLRALGVVSGMTPGEIALREARMALATAIDAAKTKASNALNANGGALADIAMKHGMNDGSETYDSTNKTAISNTVTGLKASLDEITIALKNAVRAYYVHTQTTVPTLDSITIDYSGTSTVVKIGDTDVTSSMSDVATYLAAAKTINDDIASAEAGLAAITADSGITWAQISAPLRVLMDTDNITVNGFKISEIKANEGDFVKDVMGDGVLTLQMNANSGTFEDIADFCGDYYANIVIPSLSYGTFVVEDFPAKMETKTDSNPAHFTALSNAIRANDFGAADAGAASATDKNITDIYGYAIDLAFRTNAAGSKLQLQQDAVDRIYEENGDNENTLGGGSYMEFESATLTVDQTKSLMNAIRVVFINPDATGNHGVYGIATLDTATANVAGNKVKAQLTLKDYTLGADGVITIGAAKTSQDIAELQQNKAAKITAIVYLDGDYVENKDVAISGKSLTGKLNLQFSSTATLSPMPYADLQVPAAGSVTP